MSDPTTEDEARVGDKAGWDRGWVWRSDGQAAATLGRGRQTGTGLTAEQKEKAEAEEAARPATCVACLSKGEGELNSSGDGNSRQRCKMDALVLQVTLACWLWVVELRSREGATT